MTFPIHTGTHEAPHSIRNGQLVLRFDFSVVKPVDELQGPESSFDLACRDAFMVFAAENHQHADFNAVLQLHPAADLHRVHPELTIVRAVAYTVAGTGGRLLVLT